MTLFLLKMSNAAVSVFVHWTERVLKWKPCSSESASNHGVCCSRGRTRAAAVLAVSGTS